ncbi:hypothetical protein ACIQWN_38265 [Streptomyces vinaceus]|uniref:hypothetical protein n=1 Tax=Streptomyces vinaceus TaxID=1960 RepID=UPI003804C7F2
MSGYGYPPNPQQPPHGQPLQPPKQGWSTGKKIAVGCGVPAVLGLILVGGCTALVGTAANEAAKELDKNYDSSQAGPSGGPKAASKAGEPDLTKDVKVTDCKVVSTDWGGKEFKAVVEITNSGERRYSYYVEGEIDVNGQKKADLIATGNNLAPGQKYSDDNAGLAAFDVAKDSKSSDTYECKIVKVSRHTL